MEKIAEVVPELLEDIGLTPENHAARILLERKLSELTCTARIVCFNEKMVLVEVDSSVELHELNMRKRELSRSLPEEREMRFFLRGLARPPLQSWLR